VGRARASHRAPLLQRERDNAVPPVGHLRGTRPAGTCSARSRSRARERSFRGWGKGARPIRRRPVRGFDGRHGLRRLVIRSAGPYAAETGPLRDGRRRQRPGAHARLETGPRLCLPLRPKANDGGLPDAELLVTLLGSTVVFGKPDRRLCGLKVRPLARDELRESQGQSLESRSTCCLSSPRYASPAPLIRYAVVIVSRPAASLLF